MRERTVMRGMARLFWRDPKTLPRQVLFGKADISTLLRQGQDSRLRGARQSDIIPAMTRREVAAIGAAAVPAVFAQSPQQGWRDGGIIALERSPNAKLHNVPVRSVTLTEGSGARCGRGAERPGVTSTLRALSSGERGEWPSSPDQPAPAHHRRVSVRS